MTNVWKLLTINLKDKYFYRMVSALSSSEYFTIFRNIYFGEISPLYSVEYSIT